MNKKKRIDPLKRLQLVPLIGPITAELLIKEGIKSEGHLKKQDPTHLCKKLERRYGAPLAPRIKNGIYEAIRFLRLFGRE